LSTGSGAAPPDDAGRRTRLGRRLAADLRAAATELVRCDVPEGDLAAAADLARRLRERLDGPLRARWYERNPADLAPADRSAYLEQSPIRGLQNPVAPPMQVEVLRDDPERPRVVGRVRLSHAYEGPPRGVHGGWVAALLDEILGSAQQLADRRGVTGTLKIRYRAITPIDRDLVLEAWVAEDRGRILRVKGTCRAGETLTADAEGLFVRVDFDEVHARRKAEGG
jgi:acyl-coenzyme A thioesterase PaaI-like protein